jgi:hypothetical protein
MKGSTMTHLKIMLAAGVIVGALVGQVAAQDAACPRDGDKAPLTLHKNWIMKGWERHEGDPSFVFSQKMGEYYDLENTDGVFYDNFAPGDKQLFRSAAGYGANWEGLQNAARSVAHGLTDGHNAIVSDSIASTTLGFVGRIDRLDGKVIAFDGRSQLGWQCVNGAWKIRHEMNYAWIVEPDAIEKFLGKAQ